MSFSAPQPPPQAQAPLPTPPPPQTQPGAKPGKKQQLNPTIIGAGSIPSAPLTLMGPGALGTGVGAKLLG